MKSARSWLPATLTKALEEILAASILLHLLVQRIIECIFSRPMSIHNILGRQRIIRQAPV